MSKFFLTLFLLICVSFSAETPLLPIGSEAPSFVLPTPSGTREYLRTWCGTNLAKPFVNNIPHRVILSFWSTTCVPCMKEIPALHKFAAQHSSEPIKIFLVNLDNATAAEIQTFAKEKGWTIPILLDPYQSVAKRFNVTALPTVYIISPDGKIEQAFTGVPENTTADTYIEELLRKTGTPPTPPTKTASPTAKK